MDPVPSSSGPSSAEALHQRRLFLQVSEQELGLIERKQSQQEPLG